jgi:DNA-binding CsgD family transcriptional regulator
MDQPLTPDEELCRAAGSEIRLTQRQAEILALVAQGASDNEIAMQLCLSAKTVSWYVKEIRTLLRARSRTHAVALAMQYGLLSGISMPDEES